MTREGQVQRVDLSICDQYWVSISHFTLTPISTTPISLFHSACTTIHHLMRNTEKHRSQIMTFELITISEHN